MQNLKDSDVPINLTEVDGKQVILMGDYYLPVLEDELTQKDIEKYIRVIRFFYKFGFNNAMMQYNRELFSYD